MVVVGWIISEGLSGPWGILGMFNVCLKVGEFGQKLVWKVSVISLLHSKENNVKGEVLLGGDQDSVSFEGSDVEEIKEP